MGVVRFNKEQLFLLEKILEKVEHVSEILDRMQQNFKTMKESRVQCHNWEDEEENAAETVEDGAKVTTKEENIPTEVEEIVHTTIPEHLREIAQDFNEISNGNAVLVEEKSVVAEDAVETMEDGVEEDRTSRPVPSREIILCETKGDAHRVGDYHRDLPVGSVVRSTQVARARLWTFDPGICTCYFSTSEVHPLFQVGALNRTIVLSLKTKEEVNDGSGQLSTRNSAHPLGASEYLVWRFDIYRKLEKHRGYVNTVSFNANGDILVLGSDSKRVILWDWGTGHVKLSFHSDGQVRLAEISKCGVEIKLLAKHQARAHKLAIETGSPHIFYNCGEDGLVQHFDWRTQVATKLFTCQPIDDRRNYICKYEWDGSTNFWVISNSLSFPWLVGYRRIMGCLFDAREWFEKRPHRYVESWNARVLVYMQGMVPKLFVEMSGRSDNKVYTAVSQTTATPIERVKILTQNQFEINTERRSVPCKDSGECFEQTMKEEDFESLWEVLSYVYIITQFPQVSTGFGIHEVKGPLSAIGIHGVILLRTWVGTIIGSIDLIFFYSHEYAIRNGFSTKIIRECRAQSLLTFFVILFHALAVVALGTVVPVTQNVPTMMIGTIHGFLPSNFTVYFDKKLNIKEGTLIWVIGSPFCMHKDSKDLVLGVAMVWNKFAKTWEYHLVKEQILWPFDRGRGVYSGIEFSAVMKINNVHVGVLCSEVWFMIRLFTRDKAIFYDGYYEHKGDKILKGTMAVGFTIDSQGEVSCHQFELRQVIAATVASDPTEYSEAILDNPNEDHCAWIVDLKKWGGDIELSILVDYYGREGGDYSLKRNRHPCLRAMGIVKTTRGGEKKNFF